MWKVVPSRWTDGDRGAEKGPQGQMPNYMALLTVLPELRNSDSRPSWSSQEGIAISCSLRFGARNCCGNLGALAIITRKEGP